VRLLIVLILTALLTACATAPFTVDDGRKVDEQLLGNIRHFGAGEQALRPAIVRSALLKDPACDRQWELPFAVATSYDLKADDRVAWVRALGVDERLTVIATSGQSALQLQDKIVALGNYKASNSVSMLAELARLRDAGAPFQLSAATGKTFTITPLQVCRGYTRLAPPNNPLAQDYHWLLTLHPLQIAQQPLTEEEALWAVLWTQGVSEEGGARMKTYDYGIQIVSTVYNLVTLVTGVQAASVAINVAAKAAQSLASQVATDMLKKQLLAQATAAASAKLRESVSDGAQKIAQQQAINAMQQAATNRGLLTGIARVAATVFDRADAWAYSRMQRLDANPLAGFSLHQKLVEQRLTDNALVLDPARMAALSKLAEKNGRTEEVVAILGGLRPDQFQVAMRDMPVASAPGGFSYDEIADAPDAGQPATRGLIDSMLHMPVASGSAR